LTSVRERDRDALPIRSKPAGAPAGTFTVTEVNPERLWAAKAGIPFGSLRGPFGLEERGLAVKEPDPADARVKRMHLTDEGRDLARRGIRIAVDVDEELFGPDHDALKSELERIAAQAKASS